MTLETYYSSRKLLLSKSQALLRLTTDLVIKIGCELEFFLLNGDGSRILDGAILSNFITKVSGKAERGIGQIELVTNFTDDIFALANHLDKSKEKVKNLAIKLGLLASFESQPFLDDCGSSLQFNISIHDKNDQNIFIEGENKTANLVIHCLLNLTNQMMVILCPNQEDYARFSTVLNKKLFQMGKFTAPVNLSAGNDNRSCAIRIARGESGKRIEYRIASPNADIYLALAAILIGVHYSITKEQKDISTDKFFVYGNAFDDKYNLQPLISNLHDANEKFFAKNSIIKNRFDDFISRLSYTNSTF